MSSSTTLGQPKDAETSENSTTLFVAVMGKDLQKDSFPCYWLLLRRPRDVADAESVVRAEDIAEDLQEVLTKILIDPLLETLWGANIDALDSLGISLRETDYKTIAI